MNASQEDASQLRLLALLEAAIFVSPEPLPIAHLAYPLGETPERVRTFLDTLTAEFAKPQHGLVLRPLADGYQLTKPEHHQELCELVENLPPPAPLSKTAVRANDPWVIYPRVIDPWVIDPWIIGSAGAD
jgi:chromosome segregation and condensation protein ScpB